MIIKRSNITEILGGVPFSKNFSILQMKTSIEKALPNIKEIYPQLFEDLALKIVEMNNLIANELLIGEQAKLVSSLQEKIKSVQSTLSEVRLIYETQNQSIIGIMGTAPTSGAPLYPLATVQTKPLINSITQTDASLNELQDQLEKKTEELTQSCIDQKQNVEKLGLEVQSSIERVDVIEYDTNINQYIYT